MRPRAILKTSLQALFAAYVVLVLVGIGVVWAREPVVETPRRPDAQRGFEAVKPGVGDYAHWKHGAVVRASSYHTLGQHHPLFVVDGQAEGVDPVQKWTSHPDDQDPWFEVGLPAPIDLTGVVLAHAGVVENPNLSVKQYEIVCLRDGVEVERDSYYVQLGDLERHDLTCPSVDTVRVEFVAGPDRQKKVARIYEIELYGDPTDG